VAFSDEIILSSEVHFFMKTAAVYGSSGHSEQFGAFARSTKMYSGTSCRDAILSQLICFLRAQVYRKQILNKNSFQHPADLEYTTQEEDLIELNLVGMSS
jgi:hypothetical protein